MVHKKARDYLKGMKSKDQSFRLLRRRPKLEGTVLTRAEIMFEIKSTLDTEAGVRFTPKMDSNSVGMIYNQILF